MAKSVAVDPLGSRSRTCFTTSGSPGFTYAWLSKTESPQRTTCCMVPSFFGSLWAKRRQQCYIYLECFEKRNLSKDLSKDLPHESSPLDATPLFLGVDPSSCRNLSQARWGSGERFCRRHLAGRLGPNLGKSQGGAIEKGDSHRRGHDP